MRRTLLWKEMCELAPVLGILIALELLLAFGFRLLPPGRIPDSFLSLLVLFAAAVLGVALGFRDRLAGTTSLLSSLPIPRGRILAARWGAGLASLLLVTLGALAVRRLAMGRGWIWTPPWLHGPLIAFAVLLAGCGAAAWWLRTRPVHGLPASRSGAPSLLEIEWRQKKALLVLLVPLPFLHLVGAGTLGLTSFSVLGWGWLGGALVGASLFTARERDGARFVLHALPIARSDLVAGRLLGGLAFGGLYLIECLLVLRMESDSLTVHDLFFAVLMFVFFYGSAFLIGAALSPWLRSTVVGALLALVSTYLMVMVLASFESRMDGSSGIWAGSGIILTALAAVAGWSTVRSRAFEPSPGKDFRAVLVVFVLWLAVAGILSLS